MTKWNVIARVTVLCLCVVALWVTLATPVVRAQQPSEELLAAYEALEVAIGEVRGREVLGLNTVTYSSWNWVDVGGGKDPQRYNWRFVQGDGRQFLRDVLTVENGKVSHPEFSGPVQVSYDHQKTGIWPFGGTTKDVWWSTFTETIDGKNGRKYVLARQLHDRYGNYYSDTTGNRPSTVFLSHAVPIVQKRATEECVRRFEHGNSWRSYFYSKLPRTDFRAMVLFRDMFERVSTGEEGLYFNDRSFDRLCAPDAGGDILEIFLEAFVEVAEERGWL